MKKLSTKTMLGVAVAVAGVASSYGQGSVWLDNYSAAGSPLISFGSGAGSGGVTGSQYHAALYFQLGSLSDGAGNGSLLGSLAASPTTTGFLTGAGAGYLNAVIASIPGYSSGTISFEVVAYNGADYASSTVRGHSAAFTLNSIATGTTLPGFLDGLQAFQITPVVVPEPSTFALIGLGTGALLFFRRRK